jgi:hypothetical protein
MILYLKNPKDSTKKNLALINTFSKLAGYKTTLQKSAAFLRINNEKSEKGIGKTTTFLNSFKKIPRNKLN